jgi:hypothetical protein
MNDKYICRRCNYSTDKACDIKRHLFKKVSCIKNINGMKMSDDQNIILSLLPSNKNILIEEYEIEHLKYSDTISNNKKELFDLINEIDRHRIKICKYCSIEYDKVINLKKHIIIQCFYKKILNKNIENNQTNFTHNTINSNNSNNNNIINNNNNNITNCNIFLGVQAPIPFDDKWDTSRIDDTFIASVLNSKYMYSQLLKEILENQINLNVIIDKNSNSGLVYKNNIDKYILMKSSDIVNNTMDKLNYHLLEMNKDEPTQFDEVIDYSRKMINKKYIDYNKDEVLNSNVNYLMSNIYNEKKDKATQIFNTLLETDKEYKINLIKKQDMGLYDTQKLKGF